MVINYMHRYNMAVLLEINYKGLWNQWSDTEMTENEESLFEEEIKEHPCSPYYELNKTDWINAQSDSIRYMAGYIATT